MNVHSAIRAAAALLPGEPVDEGSDPRWQAIIRVGRFIEPEPEPVWEFICAWGNHPQEDLRSAIACVLLEHLLEHHFAVYFPRVQALADQAPLFGACFLGCWPFGQSEHGENRQQFDALRDRLNADEPPGGRPSEIHLARAVEDLPERQAEDWGP